MTQLNDFNFSWFGNTDHEGDTLLRKFYSFKKNM